MPVYEYECAEHGFFEEMRPMSAFKDPCPCPACGADAPRATALPRLAVLSAGDRHAHATNERSRHEPKSTREDGAAKGHVHGPNCGCGSSAKNSKTLRRADGSKSFPSKRPWMISH
ncbi:MAG: zinc ribbon domain-containing protein [Pseudomonadota bacterium]